MTFLTFTNDPGYTTVAANPTGELLGWVQWNGTWQQRVFRPRMGTLWSPPLLQEIAGHIQAMPAYEFGDDK